MTNAEATTQSKVLDQVWTPERQQDFLQELARRRDAIRDFRVDAGALRLNIEGTEPAFEFENGEIEQFPLNPLAHSQLANRLNIPKQYYDRMLENSLPLLRDSVRTWLDRTDSKYILRTIDGRARALLSNHYRILDNYDLMAHAVLPAIKDFAGNLGAPLQMIESALTERRLYMKVVTDRVQGEVKRGDIVQAGFIVSNSEVGAGTWKIEQFIWRLVCKNGMITGRSMKRYHLGSGNDDEDGTHEIYSDSTRRKMDEVVIAKTRDIIGACLNRDNFEAELNKFREQAQMPIKADPAKVIEMTGQAFEKRGFLAREADGIMESLMTAGDMTAFGLINAVTDAAKTVGDYDRKVDLERFGGRLAEYTPQDWQRVMDAAKN